MSIERLQAEFEHHRLINEQFADDLISWCFATSLIAYLEKLL
ncbi:hypothetical protein [Limnohabitans sp.]|nr:hypothetical protein [Limnohabitans sp.]